MLVACAVLMVPSAAQADEFVRPIEYEVPTAALKKTEIRKTAASKPLVLPNITALSVKLWKSDRDTLRPQLTRSTSVLKFWKSHRWILAPNKEKCWEVPWQRSCTAGRASYRLHTALATIAERRLEYELPATNDWLTAVRIAQRAYPGTDSWMLYISDREGGWGPWVWFSGACTNPPCLWRGYHVGGDNVSGADTVGGPMQFRWSTFHPYWRAAKADLERRGFIIPEMKMPPEGGPAIYAPWLSPLGQALTAGYMKYYGKEGCHWCLG